MGSSTTNLTLRIPRFRHWIMQLRRVYRGVSVLINDSAVTNLRHASRTRIFFGHVNWHPNAWSKYVIRSSIELLRSSRTWDIESRTGDIYIEVVWTHQRFCCHELEISSHELGILLRKLQTLFLSCKWHPNLWSKFVIRGSITNSRYGVTPAIMSRTWDIYIEVGVGTHHEWMYVHL